MRVGKVEARDFRNFDRATVELGEGITVVHGPNGAGKTNLLEAVHFALAGGSCRTRNERELIAFGVGTTRVEVDVTTDAGTSTFAASIARNGERKFKVEGPASASGERPPVGVFLPDRLALVKGAPGERRTHLDRFIAALWPARAELRRRFGRALAQRNALLGRIRSGEVGADALAAWDGAFAQQAMAVIEARREATTALRDPFARLAAELGLGEDGELRYRPRIDAESAEQIEAELAERRDEDLARGYSAHGPQGDEVLFELGGRSLRRYGSQGQQRLTLLAVLLAERELLLSSRGTAPLILLDDVMSELDPEHRGLLTSHLLGDGQALITATEPEQVPSSQGVTTIDVLQAAPRAAEPEAEAA